MPEQPEIVFLVPSRRGGDRGGRVETTARGDGDATVIRLAARPGHDVVRIELVNGPELILHPETARDLLLSQQGAPTRARSNAPNDPVTVPARLQWPGSERISRARGGEGAGVLLHAFEVVKETVSSKGANLLMPKVAEWVDGLVKPGLHPLTERTPKLDGPTFDLREKVPPGQPVLVLVHGTFSSTAGSFKRLWDDHPDLVRRLLEKFDGHVYGFEHATLGVSPIENALALARVLPAGAPVHFLTHSRGGLVVEALAQLAGRPLVDGELAAFDVGEKEQRAAYDEQKKQLQALGALAQGHIQVERVVRVACPARGTLLASKRLDAYLSILKWGLELAQVPVAPTLVEFLGEVAKRRAEPQELPGLEAMMPDSPFLRWLHASTEPIAGGLRVVAGDLQGDSIGSWVKTLLADAFYWTDNDLIVQTRSMYGGSPRKGGSSFFLDRGGKVTHFNYFSNRRTAEAAVRALEDQGLDDFQSIGPESSEGKSATGSRGRADVVAASRSAAKPAVVVLPGILGTHLKVDGQRVWLSPYIFNGLPRLHYAPADEVEPDGLLGPYYDALIARLAEEYEVIPFPFDWRKPIREEARRLAEVVRKAIADRARSGQPVRLVAHSMGSLVARAMQFEVPQAWEDLMRHPDARLLMLGPPNGGSWAPMQVLSGDNLIGGLVSHFGTLFDEARAREIFAGLPGFMQLQAGLLDEAEKLWLPETWKALETKDRAIWGLRLPWHRLSQALHEAVDKWGIPSPEVLESARTLHRDLQEQDLGAWATKIVMVVGTANRTPAGIDVGGDGFGYLQIDRGDGTVTLADALLPGIRAWQVVCEHGHLPKQRELYDGYLDLLSRGSTTSQPFLRVGATRGGAAAAAAQVERMPRTARLRGWTEEALAAVEGSLSLPAEVAEAGPGAATPRLVVSVMNGDLTFVKEPLLLGHYRSLALTGAERVIDRFLEGTMTRALKLRSYPSRPEESKIFHNQRPNPDNPLDVPRPAAVIVVGLGPEGELRAEELSRSVRQGVIDYARELAQDPGAASSFAVAATLVGSGGLGVSVGTAARAVALGVRAANEKLLEHGCPIVARLRFVELYEDRAVEALRELVAAAERLPASFQVERVLESGHRPLPRPETPGYRGAEYDYVSALEGPAEDGQATIAFAVDTRRARTEVRSSSTQLELLLRLIKGAEADRRADAMPGKSLFRVLVPAELDSFFGDSDAVVLEVDDLTAAIPWEILAVDHDDGQTSDRPWAVRTKLLRKLRSKRFRENPSPADGGQVLVFGDPDCDRSVYPELPGARREAQAVAEALGQQEVHVKADAQKMVHELLARPYSVVHIAGHGREDGSGVVMSGDLVLGAQLVSCMRRVPDLVFVNCCYSGRQSLAPGADVGGRPQRAATIASALIRIGVRCVIATGWAVDDDAAERFAKEFYGALRRKKSFIEATSWAREVIWREFKGSNTWAAYQCYGDPDWVMASPDAGTADQPVRSDAPLIATPSALVVALRTVAARRGDQKARVSRLADLEQAHGESWGKLGEVAEAFAAAHSELGDRQAAISWYWRAVEAEKGGASYRSLEQLCNLSVRTAVDRVFAAYQGWTKIPGKDHQAFDAAVEKAGPEISEAERHLQGLKDLHPTYERLNLLASAAKRRAMIQQLVQIVSGGRASAVSANGVISRTRDLFKAAEEQAREQRRGDLYYSLLNRMTADMLLHLSDPVYSADEKGIAEVEASLREARENEPEFWVFVSELELRIYRALCQRQLASLWRPAQGPGIEQELRKLHDRIASVGQWASVRDQARFTLIPYREVAAADGERAAAAEVLGLLEGFATA